jgi:hypothetical protein
MLPDKMAAPMMEWTQAKVDDLIQIWESCPCLWDVLSKDYKDKNLKKATMTENSRENGNIG